MSSRKINIRSKGSSQGKKTKSKRKISVEESSSEESDESVTSSDNSSRNQSSDSSIDSGSEDRRRRPKTKKSIQSKKGKQKADLLDKFDDSFSKKRMVSSQKLIREPQSSVNLTYQASSMRALPSVQESQPIRSRRRSQSVKLDKPYQSKAHLSDLEEVNLSSEESPKKQRNNNHTFEQSSRIHTAFSSKNIPAHTPSIPTAGGSSDPRKKLFSATIITGQIVEEKKQQALLKLREANSRPDLSIWEETNAFKDNDMVIENKTAYIYSELGSIIQTLEQQQPIESDESSNSATKIHSVRTNPSMSSRILRWICENHFFVSHHKSQMNDNVRWYVEGMILDWNQMLLFTLSFIPLMYDQGSSMSFSQQSTSDLLVSSSQFSSSSETMTLKIIGCFAVFFILFGIFTVVRVHLFEEKKRVRMQSPFLSLIFKRIPWRAQTKESVTNSAQLQTEIANLQLLEYYSQRDSNRRSSILTVLRGLLCIVIIILANAAPILIQQTIYSSASGDRDRYITSLFTGLIIIISSYLCSLAFTMILRLTNSVTQDFSVPGCVAIQLITVFPILIYLLLHIQMMQLSDPSSFYWLTRDGSDFPCVATQFEFAVVGLYAGSITFSLVKTLMNWIFRRCRLRVNMMIESSLKSQQFFLVLCMGFVSFFALPVGIVVGCLLIQLERILVNRVAIDVKNGLPHFSIQMSARFVGVIVFATALMKVEVQVSSKIACGIYADGGIGKHISDIISSNSIATACLDVITSLPFTFALVTWIIIANSPSRNSNRSLIQSPDMRSVLHAGRREGYEQAGIFEAKLEYVHRQLSKIVPRSMREVKLPKSTGNSSDHIIITENEDDFNMAKPYSHHPIDALIPQAPPRNTPNASVSQYPQPSNQAKARQNYFKSHQGKTASSWRGDQEEMKKSSDDQLSLQNHSPLLKQEWNTDDSRLLQKSNVNLNKSAFNYSFK